ncbi:MAG: dephospho-CoA kinase [Ornithinimicrobium sp.]|uniref:dephospho-CoA kinase n=1 Tax=Ornithinimicrobium sp. TaxID=1977084 RepID=UPI0026DF3EB7|nr:dephospho-CoA kinase [Ornithinimicrobium sp.]MDO5740175.1 dephospho-CoA kinase [Ornithinimicrobium sp.]
MLWVGLSGGIGSGKSTVSARLARRGALVIDADLIAREVVEPGRPALQEILQRFGAQVRAPSGGLDRAALGSIVFGDRQARRDLEAITHPWILGRTRELLDAAPEDAVVVHDIPLLVELGRAADYALTVIVSVSEQERLRRLVQTRGIDPQAARARIAAQATDEQRIAAADVLLDNEGTRPDLHTRVDRLWHERLVPFEVALRSDAASHSSGALAVESSTRVAGDAARVLERVRQALGDSLRGDHLRSARAPGQVAMDVLELQVVVPDVAVLDLPEVRDRLRRRGLLLLEEGWDDGAHEVAQEPEPSSVDHLSGWPERMIATADPGRVVHCHVHPLSSPAWRQALPDQPAAR